MNKLHQIKNKLALYGIDGFILGLVVVVLLAWIKPSLGSSDGPLPLKQISGIGVSLIFFFYGLKLSPEKLKAGLSNFPLHILVQSSTFLFFPAIVWVIYWLLGNSSDSLVWTGIFFLAALPSTVSSAVVMVSIAGGNIPAAIFNASISSLVGVIMTPFWMGLALSSSGWDIDFSKVIIDLIIQVIIPVSLGIFLHQYWGKMIQKYGAQLRLFDQTIILLIVYRSFADSFDQSLFENISSTLLIVLSVAMMGLFFGVYFSNTYLSKLLGFNKEDQITAIFCGTKKSLVHGTVMANVLFKGHPSVGVILLPIMLYHSIQLIASSIIAQRIAQQSKS